jgi:UDPglucose 6-dehydrogenase/GDP-mannose 6-dehydrogenase
MEVSIVGTGYVGLVTGACLAERGHRVTCVDLDAERVRIINTGVAPFYEAGLDALLQRHVGPQPHSSGQLRATTDLEEAVRGSELTLIAVGTPLGADGIDLSAVRRAAREIGVALRDKEGYHLVAVKSTVVPGTTDEVVRPILEEASGRRAGEGLGVGTNPEFLTEGQAVRDFMSPDRIVVGGIDERTVAGLAALYEGFAGVEVVRTNNKTAELIKYASNALLATAISFSNEIARLCTALGGVDVVEVMRGVHLSHYLTTPLADGGRVTAPLVAFLEAGCGFGGSCLPKDVQALIAHGARLGVELPVLSAVLRTNRDQPLRLVQVLEKHFPTLEGVRVAVLGLAFKPDTDDIRESPAIPVLRELSARRAQLRAYDPVANQAAARVVDLPGLRLCEGLEEAVEGADAVVVVTRWAEFETLPALLRGAATQPLVVDGRRMLDRRAVARYDGIGL